MRMILAQGRDVQEALFAPSTVWKLPQSTKTAPKDCSVENGSAKKKMPPSVVSTGTVFWKAPPAATDRKRKPSVIASWPNVAHKAAAASKRLASAKTEVVR